MHELAHLRRADDWTNGFQRVINALLGWNPAAQFVGQQLDLEREVACDDWVLSFVHTVRPYALCLTKMAETATWPRQMIPAPGVFATRKHISLRIERLLGAGRNIATNLSLGPAAAAIAVVGAIGLVVAFVAPSIASPSVAQPVTAVAASTPAPAVTPAHPSKASVPLKKQAHVSAPAAAAAAPAPPPRSLATAPPPRPADRGSAARGQGRGRERALRDGRPFERNRFEGRRGQRQRGDRRVGEDRTRRGRRRDGRDRLDEARAAVVGPYVLGMRLP